MVVVMAPDRPHPPTSSSPRPPRERLVALMLLAVGAVLLFSSATWFGIGQAGVGIAQVVIAAAVAGAGAVLLHRAGRTPPAA
jgi:hypothetical protein